MVILPNRSLRAGTHEQQDAANAIRLSASRRTSRRLDLLDQIFGHFPERQFVLIGDSGEADPEVYANALATHPNQVAAIWIRNVTTETRAAARYRKAFDGLPADRWQLFDQADELPKTLLAKP